jgi:hypothetical protein
LVIRATVGQASRETVPSSQGLTKGLFNQRTGFYWVVREDATSTFFIIDELGFDNMIGLFFYFIFYY